MMKFGKYLLVFVTFYFFSPKDTAFALAPLQNLLLGDYRSVSPIEDSDPLEAIFKEFDKDNIEISKQKLPTGFKNQSDYDEEDLLKKRISFGLFRGFVEEGMNLDNFCRNSDKIVYSTTEKKNQAKRAFITALQYLMLDISTQYLPLYAKYFEYQKDEYENLVSNLVNNHCSKNLTVISIRQLVFNMLTRWESSNNSFPSVSKNPYFPKKLWDLELKSSARSSEFAWTIELFKASCSWGNEIDNYRLLVPFLRSPFLASIVVREMSGKALSWSDRESSPTLVSKKNSLKVSCQNLICRRVTDEVFKREIPISIGSTGIGNDFKRLYCSEFKNATFTTKNQVPKIKKRIKEMTFDEQNMMVGQMIALRTGVPDFLIQSEEFKELKDIVRSSLDQTWDTWAFGERNRSRKNLSFEEPLSIKVVDREIHYNSFDPNFKIYLDINQGEYDKINSISGKLKASLDINFSKKFLKWAKSQMMNLNFDEDSQKLKRIRIPFRKIIEDDIKTFIANLPTVPIGTQIIDVITDELLKQLDSFTGDDFMGEVQGLQKVKINFSFGLFALRHLHERFKILKNQGKVKSQFDRLKELSL